MELKNTPIAEIISRRALLKGIAAGAVASGFASGGISLAAAPASSFGFEEIEHGIDDMHHVAKGYTADVFLGWGDALQKDMPPADASNMKPGLQEKQFGYNNDFVAFMPLPLGSQNSDHGLLCVNHEYPNPELMFSGEIGLNEVGVQIAALGHSVVEIRKDGKKWRVVVGSPFNRRITGETKIKISGPAAGADRLKTSADKAGMEVLGTLANCSGGVTPWGTVLSGEENFPWYFSGEPPEAEAVNFKRLELGGHSKYHWEKFHSRFDIDKEPNEANRFGWVTEINPYDPKAAPVKRTALGRFKHEAATCAIAPDGRVAVYMGDDSQFEYIYKFVTKNKFNPSDRAANFDLLDEGTLYVAKFLQDGKMKWLPLVF